MPEQVFIVGYYGFENAGDEAILASIVSHLRALSPHLPISVASGNPAETRRRHAVTGILWTDTLEILRAVKASSLVIIGGGGLFHDYWGFHPGTFLTSQHTGIGYFSAPAILAAVFRKPLMLYAIGVGPILTSDGRRFTRTVCDLAATITVRDAGSKEQLTALGIAAERIAVTADPAFGLDVAEKSLSWARSHPQLTALGRRGPLLAVALRPWDTGIDAASWERQVAAALDQFLSSTDGRGILLPFQRLVGDHENDRGVAERVRRLMNESARITLWTGALSPERLFALVGACDVVCGMRLHSVIAAVVTQRPVVSLIYDPKVAQAVENAGLSDWSFDLKRLNADALAERLRDAWLRREEIAAELRKVGGPLAEAARENARLALKLLEDGRHYSPFSEDLAYVLGHGFEAQLSYTHQLAAENERERGGSPPFTPSARVDTRPASNFNGNLAPARVAANDSSGADPFRADLLERIDEYQAVLDGSLAAYRGQRAWRVMLWFRMAYTLLCRQGWRGWMRFPRWLASGVFGTFQLGEQELRFPNIWNYVAGWIQDPPTSQVAGAGSTLQTRWPPQRGSYDVVILPIVDFDFRFQRPQQIAAQFARNGHRVFWINPFQSIPEASVEPYHAKQLRPGIWEVQMRWQVPDLYSGSLDSDGAQAMVEQVLSVVYRDFGIGSHCVLVQFPFWRQVANALKAKHRSCVVYDCMDDWQYWRSKPLISDFSLEEERKLAAECDVLAVSARQLKTRYQEQGLTPVLVPNAADFTLFSSPRLHSLPAPAPRPIAGYYGAIADWFDLQLFYDVAKSRPRYSFVLIGEVYRDDMRALEKLPNVYLLGAKNYQELPLYLASFDVCLIPFLLNDLTRGVDPVKVYEYLSQGKPVVATPLEELRPLEKLLYTGRTAEEFASRLDDALREQDASLRTRRVAFASENTWAHRVEVINQAVRRRFPLVSILLVTFNCKDYLEPCFQSIERNTSYPAYEILVLDNGSTDGTPEEIRRLAGADPRVRITLLDHNAGFAGGNNLIAREARGDYFVFLNPDTIVTPGWLERLLQHTQRDPATGLTVAVTNFAGNEAKIDFDYRNLREMEVFALRVARKNAGVARNIAVAPMFCVLTPRSVWETVGELDERFRVGMFEDDDYSLRVRQAGFHVVAAEDCFVHHFGNASFATLQTVEFERTFLENQSRFEQKWKQPWTPHQLRSGVRPLAEDRRFIPREFVAVDEQVLP